MNKKPKFSGNKNFKILFGVPESEYIARQFACIAATMPDVECRFIGFSWSTGRIFRKLGLDYANVPLKYVSARSPEVVPPVIEFVTRGFTHDKLPLSVRQTFGTLEAFIDREVELFAPDIIVYGPIEHAICYLIDQNADVKGILKVGIQTSFISNYFIAQTHGSCWEEYLRSAPIPTQTDYQNLEEKLPCGSMDARGDFNQKWKLPFWSRGIERVIRVFWGGTTFDTILSLLTSITFNLVPPKWFPNVVTLESIEDINSGCVLVALHQPSLSWTNPTWIDLINFALEATPEKVPIVIRPHPSEVGRRIPKDLENKLLARGVRISRTSNGPSLATLLKKCRAVITLTSATGMEALLAGVPVFVLGHAFYARHGLANFVSILDAQKVREMITHAERFLPDVKIFTSFKLWLQSEHMVIAPEYGLTSKNSLPHRIRDTLSIGKVAIT